MSIRVKGLQKRFGSFEALQNIDLEVEDGSLLALLGPSGSGKTTLLRIIAGLENADSGNIYHHDEDVTDRDARERKVGFVFQHYALFRHMTIADNVAFGLKVRGVPVKERRDRVEELLKLIRLDHLGERYPSQLSGGQRQRVALARALAAQPKVLLLDEPFGALDAKVRQELRQWLRRLHDEIHVTSIFVTHDQEEAFEVADRIVVMNQGRIEQVGSPSEVFEQPANAFVMDFLGNVNVFHGRVEAGKAVALQPVQSILGGDNSAQMYVRPHELTLERSRLDEACIEAKVLHVNATGSRVKVELKATDGEQLINAELTPERFEALALKVNEIVYVSPSRVRVFMADYSI